MKNIKKTVSARRLVSLSCILLFFYGVLLGGTQLILDDVAAVYGVALDTMGMLVSAQFAAAVIAPVCMGQVADRVGKRPVLLAFILVFGAGCAAAGWSKSLWMYLLGACLIGAGYSVCETISSAAMTDLDETKSTQYINISQCTLCGGAVASPVILEFCMEHLGADWRLVFQVCAAALFVLAILFWNTAFPSGVRQERAEGKGKSPFTSLAFLCLFVAMILYVGLENGFGYFVDTLFDLRMDAVAWSPWAISAYWTGMTGCLFVCGLRPYKPIPVLKLCFSAIAVIFVLLAVTKEPWLAVLLCGVVGVAYGPVWSTLVAVAAAEFPENAAGAIGIMGSSGGLGGILYPAVMGAVSAYFSIQTAFFFLAVTAAVCLALCTVVAAKKQN